MIAEDDFGPQQRLDLVVADVVVLHDGGQVGEKPLAPRAAFEPRGEVLDGERVAGQPALGVFRRCQVAIEAIRLRGVVEGVGGQLEPLVFCVAQAGEVLADGPPQGLSSPR